jgi:hypothetical protein
MKNKSNDKFSSAILGMLSLYIFVTSSLNQISAQSFQVGSFDIIKKQKPIPSGVISFNGELFLIPFSLSNPIQKYTGTNFIESIRINPLPSPNGLDTRLIGVFKENLVIVSGQYTINHSKDGLLWKIVTLPQDTHFISDAVFLEDRIILVGKSLDSKSVIIKATKDLAFFETFEIKSFQEENIPNFTIRISKVTETFLISYPNNSGGRTIRTKDFLKCDYFDTAGSVNTTYLDVFGKLIKTSEYGLTSIVNTNFIPIKEIQLFLQTGSDIKTDTLYFGLGFKPTDSSILNSLHYTRDGVSWQTLPIPELTASQYRTKQLELHNSFIYISGVGEGVMKIGPISSSDPLNVYSELVHSIKINGNVGQQVEILASDELNGEYKPLTYFTLPATEFIYNDNRTNKAKQYYKVK